MSDYTFATIAIAADNKPAAQKQYPYYFNTGASATGDFPVTHYVTSGPFGSNEIAEMVKSTACGIVFDSDVDVGLSQLGLVLIHPSGE